MKTQPLRLWNYSLTVALALLIPFNLIASLGMDIYLPVVPAMPSILGTSPAIIQLTLTLYMIMLGVGQVVFGPISDRIGRRPVLAIGAILFVLSSFGLGTASSAAPFVALRGVQALGASAMLVAIFATIRDVYADKPENGTIYSLMNAMLSFVPALGPIIGAVVADAFGWRWIFYLLGIAALILVAAILPKWRETRVRRTEPTNLTARDILSSRAFWAYTFAFGTAMGAFFVFFSTAPRLLIERAGYGEFGFSLAFATVAVVMIMVSRFAASFVDRWGVPGCACRGLLLMLAGALLLLPGHLIVAPSVLSFIMPMWVVAVGIVMIGSVTANGALAEFGEIAGMAVALHFCVQSLIVGVVGTAFVIMLGGDTTLPLIFYIAVMASISFAWVNTVPEGVCQNIEKYK